MRLIMIAILVLAGGLFPKVSDAQSSRHRFIVPTGSGEILVERFRHCGRTVCPAVLILSGSRGFGAPVYDQIGQTFRAEGFNVYLVHVLTSGDLNAIATAGGARARIAYHAQRLPDWISGVQGVVSHLGGQAEHGGKVGLLGISLGAQIASAASSGRADIDALVLVDGGFPSGYAQPVRPLPPLHLIWGGADRVFPLSVGRDLHRTAQKLGGPVSLDVYENGAHDFFLKSGTHDADAAHRSAADFLAAHLLR